MTPKPDATGNHDQTHATQLPRVPSTQRVPPVPQGIMARRTAPLSGANLLLLLTTLILGLGNGLGNPWFTSPSEATEHINENPGRTHGQDHAGPAG